MMSQHIIEADPETVKKPDLIQLTENETIKKSRIIYDFASRLMEEAVELDPKFARIVSENFWDLV